MKRKIVHQVGCNILYARTATEVNAHEQTYDFAVLITIEFTS